MSHQVGPHSRRLRVSDMSVNTSKHELIHLIYRHLKEHGFHSAAEELEKHSPQVETKNSASLLKIYSSWLKGSKKKKQTKKSDSAKHKSEEQGETPSKGGASKKEKQCRKSPEDVTKAKKSKTQTQDKVVAAGEDDSDSDSSLDVEKWKKLALQFTEADLDKMEIINSLDSSTPQPKKPRERKKTESSDREEEPQENTVGRKKKKKRESSLENNSVDAEPVPPFEPETPCPPSERKKKKSKLKSSEIPETSAASVQDATATQMLQTPSSHKKVPQVRHKAGRQGDNLEEFRLKRREHEKALRQARRDRQLVSKRLLLNEDEEQPEATMDTTTGEQDMTSLFQKLQHSGPEREAHMKDLSKALRNPSAQLTFIKQENSMHLLVGLLTGSNAQCRLHAARCLHELSHSPHTSVAPACLPATPYLLTYLSGQSSKFTELCLYTLGNLCPDSDVVKEKVLAQGIIPALANCIENQRHNLAVVEAVGFTLSQLLQAKDAAAEKIISMVLSSSLPSHLLSHRGQQRAVRSWCPVTVQFLLVSLGGAVTEENREEGIELLVCPLLRCVGNLLSLCPVDSLNTQVGDIQLVVAVCALLQAYIHSQPALARESAWVLNNLTAHSSAFCSALLTHNLVPGLIQLLSFSQGINTMILRVLANIAHKNKEFCVQLAQLGLLPTLCATLKMANQEMVTLSLEVLFMLVVSRPQLADEFVRHGGVSLLEAIQYNSEGEMRRRAAYLLEHHLLPYSGDCTQNTAYSCLEMETTEPTIRERTKQQDGNQEADNAVLMSSKPLHRFVRREPRTLGSYCFDIYIMMLHEEKYAVDPYWAYNRMGQLLGVEGLLFISSLCVSALLIFLCVTAHLALKSPRTQAYLGPGAESLLCSHLVGSFALPGCQSRGLECTAIREGQLPGAMEGHLVDGVQVEGGLLLTLASRQEANAWKATGQSMPHALRLTENLFCKRECPAVTMLGFSRVPS
ncbi:hypothetical protein INR49_024383, partial [Caranx melampygus]